MNSEEKGRVITIKDLWSVLFKHLFAIIALSVLIVAAMIAVNMFAFVPQYKSTATLYILKQNSKDTPDTSEDFSLALKVVNDCDYLLKSHSVLDQVIEELKLDISYETLSKLISTGNPEETRILEVTAVSDTPEKAKKIVDKVCDVGTIKISEAMGFNQVNLYEHGVLDYKPSNRTRKLTYVMVGIASAAFVYAVFLLLFLLDDRIRTDEDIERYLGLTILGDIPSTDKKKRKKRYGYYSAYGKSKND